MAAAALLSRRILSEVKVVGSCNTSVPQFGLKKGFSHVLAAISFRRLVNFPLAFCSPALFVALLSGGLKR
jgi:hypothetical protein